MPRENTPTVSVIIPTHNRSDSLRRLLDALSVQDFPLGELEVVVVADGCGDDTSVMLRRYQAPYELSVVEQPGSGPAEARNAGAGRARTPLLIFVDDDVEPAPSFIAAHIRAHAENAGGVVIGPYPPLPRATSSLFRLRQRLWWTEKFDAVAQAAHRFTYHDLLSGNLSISAELWGKIGGFDPRFRHSREDYELGIRLIHAGVPFTFAPDAHGYHHEHETMTLGGSFRRAYNEGQSDVIMGGKHPEIRSTLQFADWYRHSRRASLVLRGLYLIPGFGDSLARAVQRLLPTLDHAGLREAWIRLYSKLRMYWYVRGAAEELKSTKDWAIYASQALPEPEGVAGLVIDLQEGLELAEARLDAERPNSVTLRFGRHPVGAMPAVSGAEPWRGAHLRSFLLHECGPAYLRALALEGGISGVTGAEARRLASAITATTKFYGPDSVHDMWGEQYAQWERLDSQLGLAGQTQN